MYRSPTRMASRSRRLWRSADARRRGPFVAGDPVGRHAAPGSLNRDRQPSWLHRLQQVVDGVDLEGLDCMLIERGDEDDVGTRSAVQHAPRHLEAGQTRHLDVQQHEVGLQAGNHIERFGTVTRLADDVDAPDLAEQIAELVARQLLVVHEYGSEIHLRR